MSEKSDLQFGPPMAIKPCEHVKKLPSRVEDYRQRFSSGGRMSVSWAVSAFEAALTDAWEKDQATHRENGPAIAHNAAMRAHLTAAMKAAGVPDSYRAPDPKSRAWPQKHKTYEAGYLGDLRRTFPVADGFDDANRRREVLATGIAAAKVEVEKEKVAREREAEAAKARRRADLALAGIILRYQLPEDSDWPEVLEALRKRDKYLDLAIAGVQTRGDWSEGFYRVEQALGRFTIEGDRDKDIVADLCGCLRSDDGRVFRDTTWSYDKLFDLTADRQLVADARSALEHCQ